MYAFFLLAALGLSVVFSLMVKRIASRLKIFDSPDGARKIHPQPVPLLGGLAVFGSFFTVLMAARFLFPLFFDSLTDRQLLALIAGSFFLMVGGYLDDKYNLAPVQQIIWPILAAAAVLLGGVNLKEITNPFGGTIKLLPAAVGLLVFGWLMMMMYTTKFLDGLDGLTTGLGAIGGLMIFFLSLTPKFYQPDLALVALILVGALLGFLVFNFPPARLFLGEGGSLLVGFLLGFLAVVSGSKIATALLVMGVPAADLLIVIGARLVSGKSPFVADTRHLHHRLLGLGLSPRQILLALYLLAAFFGVLTLFLQSREKFTALLILFSLALISGWRLLK